MTCIRCGKNTTGIHTCTPSHYRISKEVVEQIKEALNNNWFVLGDDGEEYNNQEVIDAEKALDEELKIQ